MGEGTTSLSHTLGHRSRISECTRSIRTMASSEPAQEVVLGLSRCKKSRRCTRKSIESGTRSAASHGERGRLVRITIRAGRLYVCERGNVHRGDAKTTQQHATPYSMHNFFVYNTRSGNPFTTPPFIRHAFPYLMTTLSRPPKAFDAQSSTH